MIDDWGQSKNPKIQTDFVVAGFKSIKTGIFTLTPIIE
jgi:hypothetical protein